MGPPVEEFGPYLVYEQLGAGGMATVHRAETRGIEGFSRPIALKRMLPSVAGNADLVQSFVREAHLASQLRHENVAQTYDLGKVDGIYFIAMELVPGRNLREIMKHCGRVTGPMPLRMALNILNQICDALDYAHNLSDDSGRALGIIHRDVSPSNIIVSDSGVVKLIDFGIAKASMVNHQTMTGTLKGKFGYMAPEYIGGRIDARADLFALGIVAHELLTNQPLFQGKDDMDTLIRVKQMSIPPPSQINASVPPEIDAIVMTALARDPEQRWQAANALRTALTTETRRLGAVALNAHVVQWVEWAFERAVERTIEPSEPSIHIESGTAALQPPRIPPTPPTAPVHGPNVVANADQERTRIRPSKPRLPTDDAPTTQPVPPLRVDEFDDPSSTTAPLAPPLRVDEFDDQPATTLREPRSQPAPSPAPPPPPTPPIELRRKSGPPLTPSSQRASAPARPLDPMPMPMPMPMPVRPSPAAIVPMQPSDALRGPHRPSAPSVPPLAPPPHRGSMSSMPPFAPTPPYAAPQIPEARSDLEPPHRWGLWAALAILIVAVAAAAVVYFWPTP